MVGLRSRGPAYGDQMDLTSSDTDTIQECLTAAADGPFFDDQEFHTLFGLDREEVRLVAQQWPETGDPEVQRVAVTNSLNHLLWYPHRREDVWHSFISAERVDVALVYARWRGERTLDSSAQGYFDRLE